jgi:lysophospholipase L1-like esterase
VPQRDRRPIRRHVHLGPALAGLLVAVLAGCGSGEATTAGAGGDAYVVAALGDSITAGNPAYDPDPDQRAALGFGADKRSQYEYWAARGDPGLTVRNCGVFGERTDEIARRLDTCAAGADALIVQGGINDIAQGRPVAMAASDLDSMVVRGKRAGLDVYLADVLPWNNGHPAADAPIAALNRLIGEIGTRRRVPVLGFHDALSDPDAPTLMAPALTADGDHPSIAGYRRLGTLLAAKLRASAAG